MNKWSSYIPTGQRPTVRPRRGLQNFLIMLYDLFEKEAGDERGV